MAEQRPAPPTPAPAVATTPQQPGAGRTVRVVDRPAWFPNDARLVSGSERGATFGAMLRELRSSAAMSQRELASAAAIIDPTYVSLIERGERRTVRRDVVLAFAEALDLTTGQTDRLLYAAGHAPETDYQKLYEARFGAIDSRTKWCPGCSAPVPVKQFSRNSCRADGLTSECKACVSRRMKAYATKVALRRMGRAS